jgi:DNA polymerase
MSSDKEILKWYLESGIDEITEDTPINHFEEYKKQKTKKADMTTKNDKQDTSSQKAGIQTSFEIPTQNTSFHDGKAEMEIAKKAIANVKTLKELEQTIKDFSGCKLVKSIAKNTVFSRGNPEGDIILIGEAPGADEDTYGIPFCGQSGQLLDNMLKSIGLYDRVYITNTLFWRPPGNRRPTDDELMACSPFLKKHIQLFNPKLIIAIGATAMSSVLKQNLGVTQMRRKFFDYTNEYMDKSVKATPLFHPSFLLRQPIRKRDTWKDWLIVKDFVNENI